MSFRQDLNFKDLPILVRVCPIPGFDKDELVDAGYLNTAYYFRGISRFNSSFLAGMDTKSTIQETLNLMVKDKYFIDIYNITV